MLKFRDKIIVKESLHCDESWNIGNADNPKGLFDGNRRLLSVKRRQVEKMTEKNILFGSFAFSRLHETNNILLLKIYYLLLNLLLNLLKEERDLFVSLTVLLN